MRFSAWSLSRSLAIAARARSRSVASAAFSSALFDRVDGSIGDGRERHDETMNQSYEYRRASDCCVTDHRSSSRVHHAEPAVTVDDTVRQNHRRSLTQSVPTS
jgi:hypothetical protein